MVSKRMASMDGYRALCLRLHCARTARPRTPYGFQCLDDLEVIIALAHEQLDGLPAACGRRKIARLALELGRFRRAIRHDERRVEVGEMALRAQQVRHLIGERDVGAADREAHGLQVEHAATAQPPLMISAGRSNAWRQSVVRSTPARWPPEEWPET